MARSLEALVLEAEVGCNVTRAETLRTLIRTLTVALEQRKAAIVAAEAPAGPAPGGAQHHARRRRWP